MLIRHHDQHYHHDNHHDDHGDHHDDHGHHHDDQHDHHEDHGGHLEGGRDEIRHKLVPPFCFKTKLHLLMIIMILMISNMMILMVILMTSFMMMMINTIMMTKKLKDLLIKKDKRFCRSHPKHQIVAGHSLKVLPNLKGYLENRGNPTVAYLDCKYLLDVH